MVVADEEEGKSFKKSDSRLNPYDRGKRDAKEPAKRPEIGRSYLGFDWVLMISASYVFFIPSEGQFIQGGRPVIRRS